MFSTLTRAVRKTPAKPGLLIVGHSHVECLGRAVGPQDSGVHVISLSTDRKRLLPTGRKLFVSDLALGKPTRLCLCLGGNAHSKLGLFNHPTPFTLDQSEDGKVLIPNAVIRETMMTDLRQAFALARILRAQFADSPCVFLVPPPPIGDPKHIHTYPGIFRAQIPLGISPPALRRALYRLQCGLYADLAAETGDPLLMAPDHVLDGNGFLTSEYAHRDPTHGNTDYGRVMLDLIQQHFEVVA